MHQTGGISALVGQEFRWQIVGQVAIPPEPIGTIVHPGEGRDELAKFPGVKAHKIGTHAYIGIVNLSGKRIGAGRSHGVPHPGLHNPADGIVAHVRRIPIGIIRHLFHDNGIFEPDALERFIPQQHPFAYGIPVFHGNGVFQPENDGFLGRRKFKTRLGFFQLPAINVVPVGGIFHQRGVVLKKGEEMSQPVVGNARFVSGLGQGGQAVVVAMEHTARIR